MKAKKTEELDQAIRQAKGHRAVEELVRDGREYQVYLLDDGTYLRISKTTGIVKVSQAGR